MRRMHDPDVHTSGGRAPAGTAVTAPPAKAILPATTSATRLISLPICNLLVVTYRPNPEKNASRVSMKLPLSHNKCQRLCK